MNIDLEQERKTYLMLLSALLLMHEAIEEWNVKMINYSWTDDEGQTRWLRIMCFNLPAEEIHSILSKARPQSTILKSLKEDLESMMQEWYMSDWPVLTKHQMLWAQRVKDAVESEWPTWKELAPKLIEESQHA